MDLEPAFFCGDPSLDFVGTLRNRRSDPVETIGSPARLEAWLVESGLVDRVVGITESDVVSVQRLREAIYTLTAQRMADEPYEEDAVTLVNEVARRSTAVPQLRGRDRWIEATADQALAMIARCAVEVIGGSEAPLLKECANSRCTMIFIDRSRGARRQWCCMAGCGNKFKSAAYRSRQKERAGAAGH